MKYYVTMGQEHRHVVRNTGRHHDEDQFVDKDCVAVIEAGDYELARILTFATFGHKWSFMYRWEDWNHEEESKYYPNGIKYVEVPNT